MHPEKQAAIDRAVEYERKRKLDAIDTAAIIKDHGLRFIHVRSYDADGNLLQKGGVTVAYQLHDRKGRINDVLKISTSLVHPDDTYSKREGRQRSAAAFAAGQWTYLRRIPGMTVDEYITCTFLPTASPDLFLAALAEMEDE